MAKLRCNTVIGQGRQRKGRYFCVQECMLQTEISAESFTALCKFGDLLDSVD